MWPMINGSMTILTNVKMLAKNVSEQSGGRVHETGLRTCRGGVFHDLGQSEPETSPAMRVETPRTLAELMAQGISDELTDVKRQIPKPRTRREL